MSSDLGNALRMVGLLGDDEFVDALTDVEELIAEVNETLDRVEEVETEAQRAVEDADESLQAVDARLDRFDEMISLLEAEIEAVFSAGFLYFAFTQWTAGNGLLAAGLLFMGLLGASSLAITVYKMPQVRKLRRVGRYASRRLEDDGDDGVDEDADDETTR